jgi:hypothetical protein
MKERTISAFNKLEKQRVDFLNIYRQQNREKLRFRPDQNSWNMLQVMRHLVTAESLSLAYIRRKLRETESIPKVGIGAKSRAVLLKMALALPIKFKAPKVAEVTEDYPDFESTIEEWNNVRKEFKEILLKADEEIFHKTIYKHPRAGYLTLKQTVNFIEDHIRHHQKQVDRIMSHPQFPNE